jgi:hypothetical protein
VSDVAYSVTASAHGFDAWDPSLCAGSVDVSTKSRDPPVLSALTRQVARATELCLDVDERSIRLGQDVDDSSAKRGLDIVSTSGGPIGQGQIFEYEPASGAMRVLYASPASDILNNPDNIAVSPRGGIVLCEDGSGIEYLHGLTPDGEIFRFAANNIVVPPEGVRGKPAIVPGDYTGSEWAGATFEPKNGDWLFVNIQSPGITFAITGPWRRGAL